VYHVGQCHAPHVSSDHPDHEDRDHGDGEQKDVERTACAGIVGTLGVGTTGDAISVPCAAAEVAVKVMGNHDASAVCRPWEGMLQCNNGRAGECACVVSYHHVQLRLFRRPLQQQS
jgi:hypothetical protein